METPRQPRLTVDVIVEREGAVLLVKRKHPPLGYALPGGFVDYGESLETAAIREAKEETDLDVTLVRQFHAYSDPARDPRAHTISMVFLAEARGEPRGGDDASEARFFSLDALPDLVFDHAEILADYRRQRDAGSINA